MTESTSTPPQRWREDTIRYTDEEGVKREGVFRYRAMSSRDEHVIERIAANFANMPWEQLSPNGRALFEAAARVIVCTEENPDNVPGWFQPIRVAALELPAVTGRLGVLILQHTQEFRVYQCRANGVAPGTASVEVPTRAE